MPDNRKPGVLSNYSNTIEISTWVALQPENKAQRWSQMDDSHREQLWKALNDAQKQEIIDIEFQQAQRYFTQSQTNELQKVSRKQLNSRHSFVKIDGEVFMLQREELGRGATAKVKTTQRLSSDEMQVEDRAGQKIVVKIIAVTGSLEEKEEIKRAAQNEMEALTRMGDLVTSGTRSTHPKPTSKGQTSEKIYIMMKEKPGIELFELDDKLEEKGIKLTKEQRAIIGLKCCQEVLKAHQQGIIHGDLSPSNFKIEFIKNEIKVHLIDYGNCKILKPGETMKQGTPIGSAGYYTTDVMRGEYSKASDIFALAQVLRDVGIYSGLYDHMKENLPENRGSIESTMQNIIEDIAQLNLKEETQKAIQEAQKVMSAPIVKDDLSQINQPQQPTLQTPLIDKAITHIVQSASGIAFFPSDHQREINAQLKSLLKTLESIKTPGKYDVERQNIMLALLVDKVANSNREGFNHPTVKIIVESAIRDLNMTSMIEQVRALQVKSSQSTLQNNAKKGLK